MPEAPLSWFAIGRIGLVQTALGAIVVLTTSTMNRVMVVELALPAMVPGALVAIHYALQLLRPRWGYGSDVSRRRTPWIIGGMFVLAIGGIGAAVSIAVMGENFAAGLALAILAFVLIGIGVGATGTSLLALLASRVGAGRRAPAATVVWLMMIAGFIVTTVAAGSFLDPYSPSRLVAVTTVVSVIAVIVATLAILGVEGKSSASPAKLDDAQSATKPNFAQAFQEVWSEPQARQFTIFIFVSMLAYSMQDLILEPFAGLVFGLTPGQSTKLSGLQHSGVFAGMVLVAIAAHKRVGLGSLSTWVAGGCMMSALQLLCVAAAGMLGQAALLKTSVFALGVANGAYAVAAIGCMMGLAASGRNAREGTRMGIWGASQAVAFGVGGFGGTALADLARQFLAPVTAYSSVFVFEAGLFVVAAIMAIRILGNGAVDRNGGMSARPAGDAGTGNLATETGRYSS